MAQEWKVEGKHMLITGGAAGLGAAYAVTFLKSGAKSPEFYNNTDVRILTICFGATSTAMMSNLQSRLIEQTCTKMYNACVPFQKQSVDSAVKAIMKMYLEGKPGSIWLSQCDQPGQDITTILDEAYRPIDDLIKIV